VHTGSEETSESSKPAKVHTGSEEVRDDPKPATVHIGSDGPGEAETAPADGGSIGAVEASAPALSVADCGPQRGHSACWPWRQVIEAKREEGLSVQRIYQDLLSEHGFARSYYSVLRFVRRLGRTRPLPYRRMECGPGEEAQVDFGSGIAITAADGKQRRTHVFRIVLSYSRKGYSEAVYRQTTDEFIRCLENAWWYFGGVPQCLVLDNLKAAVAQADWYDPELNPKMRSFAEYYGLAVLPTKPRTPRHKGKIERGIGYVKNNALKGHTFTSLEEENRHLLDWEQSVADTRLHGTTRQQVGRLFEAERAALRPLPAERFPFFHEGQRTVNRDGHIEVARAYYSVPPEFLGRQVWARWDGRLVRIFNQRMEQVAVHVQGERGRFSTQAAHLASEKISGVERGAAWLLLKVARVGHQATAWAEAVLEVRGIEGVRVLQGLLALSQRHSGSALDQACAVAYSHASYRLRTIRQLLQRQSPAQDQFGFMEEHPIIRGLSEYAELVRQCQ